MRLSKDGPTRITGLCHCGLDETVDADVTADTIVWQCPRCGTWHEQAETIEDVMGI